MADQKQNNQSSKNTQDINRTDKSQSSGQGVNRNASSSNQGSKSDKMQDKT